MVEPVMFFALGALSAGLFALLILPFVHQRAVRLAMRRVEANLPVSLANIRADKDLLRAEFAVTALRYETTIDQLKSRMADQMAELGRKTREIARLKLRFGETRELSPDARHLAANNDVPTEPGQPGTRPRVRLAELAKLNPDFEQSPLVPGMDEFGGSVSPRPIEPVERSRARGGT
jgi:uncharacterized membrane protein YccC